MAIGDSGPDHGHSEVIAVQKSGWAVSSDNVFEPRFWIISV